MFDKKRKKASKEFVKKDNEITKKVEEDKKETLDSFYSDPFISEIINTKIDPYCPIEKENIFDPSDIMVYPVNYGAKIFAFNDSDATNEFVANMFMHDFRAISHIHHYADDCVAIMSTTIYKYIESVTVNSCMNIVAPIGALTNSKGLSLFQNINFLGFVRKDLEENDIILNQLKDLFELVDITVVDNNDFRSEINLHAEAISRITELISIQVYSCICTAINNALDAFCYGENQEEVKCTYKNILYSMQSITEKDGSEFVDPDEYPVLTMRMQEEVKNWFLGMFIESALKGLENWLTTEFADQFKALIVTSVGSSLPMQLVKAEYKKKYTTDPEVIF